MSLSGSKNKVANSLVAMSSAAVLVVYAAGYTRTRPAAHQIEARAAERRPANPVPAKTDAPMEEPSPVPAVPVSGVDQAVAVPPAAKAVAPPKTKTVEASVVPTPSVPAAPVAAAPAPAAPVAEVKKEVIASVPATSAPATPAPTTPAPANPTPAPPAPTAPATPAVPAAPTWKDGTYLGWGTSRHGDIQAAVVITGGRIESATIAECRTRYSCSVIETLPPEVAQRQSPDVDTVSGATQSADAFYYAVVDALKQAK